MHLAADKLPCFRASPQLLKKCIFYLSVFPWDSIIRRRRLVRRWMAEGCSRGTNSNTSEEEVEKLIDKLLNLCVPRALRTIPVPGAMRVASCQLLHPRIHHFTASPRENFSPTRGLCTGRREELLDHTIRRAAL